MIPDIEKVKTLISRLEVEKGVKERNLNDLRAKLAELQPKVENFFGTSDIDVILSKLPELENELAEKLKELEKMNVTFS